MSSYIDENERLVEENRRLRAAMFKLNLENVALRAEIDGLRNSPTNGIAATRRAKAFGDAS